MSVPEAGQSTGRGEQERDDYEQHQTRVLVALMQGFSAARYRKSDNTPCPIDQVWRLHGLLSTTLSYLIGLSDACRFFSDLRDLVMYYRDNLYLEHG